MILDFEKARDNVREVLAGKVTTVTLLKVVFALQAAAVDPAQNDSGDCGPGCARYPTCEYNHGRHGVVRINCPLWRAKR